MRRGRTLLPNCKNWCRVRVQKNKGGKKTAALNFGCCRERIPLVSKRRNFPDFAALHFTKVPAVRSEKIKKK